MDTCSMSSTIRFEENYDERLERPKQRLTAEAEAFKRVDAQLEQIIRMMPENRGEQGASDDLSITSPESLDDALQLSEPVVQPAIQPSPCLRKSLISEDVENDMYPLGEAKTFVTVDWKQEFGNLQQTSIYGGNPFASIQKSRGGVSSLRNKNDFSDLKDLPICSPKKSSDFVQSSEYQEELVILKGKEDPNLPLDARGQPPFVRVHLLALRRSGNVFAKLLLEKDHPATEFTDSSLVYSFDQEPEPNIHIQEYAIYIDSLITSDFIQSASRYRFVERLAIDQFWMGLKVWSEWARKVPMELPCGEENIEGVGRVGIFLNDPAYAKELYEQIVGQAASGSSTGVGILSREVRVFLCVVASRVM